MLVFGEQQDLRVQHRQGKRYLENAFALVLGAHVPERRKRWQRDQLPIDARAQLRCRGVFRCADGNLQLDLVVPGDALGIWRDDPNRR